MTQNKNQHIKQQDVNKALWSACETFRREMNGRGSYKDYFLAMMFIKYISDVWKYRYEEYSKKYGDDHVRIRRKLERERFILPQGASFYDLYEKRYFDIGNKIDTALNSIVKSNKRKLKGAFSHILFDSECSLGNARDRHRRLRILLEAFHKPQLDMSPSRMSQDVIGNAYAYMVERLASAPPKDGEFYTPQKVSELFAKPCKPNVGDRICDPACGSGGNTKNKHQNVSCKKSQR